MHRHETKCYKTNLDPCCPPSSEIYPAKTCCVPRLVLPDLWSTREKEGAESIAYSNQFLQNQRIAIYQQVGTTQDVLISTLCAKLACSLEMELT